MVTTRFPPSPTGDLHIGSVRTALYSWAFARQHQGKFVLRIEDTDRERSTEQAVAVILEGMQWLGLDYDQGPFFQSKRLNRYQEIIQKLLEQGDAYYCNCSKQRLEQLRQQQRLAKQKPKYDGHCRNASNLTGEQVIRFKNPQIGSVTFDDLVRGKVTVNNQELDDLIICRSDGSPTYNLCVVVDDMDMNISHVIRGDDHINNTPRQINILKALGAQIPQYAHVPMILGSDGTRLSKRHGALSLLHYRDNGILPEALLNYLVRLGWSFGEQEIFSLDEIIKLFDINKVNVAPSTFNPEKLIWVNQQHIMQAEPSDLVTTLQMFLTIIGVDSQNGPDLIKVVEVQQSRVKTMLEMAQESCYFYQDFSQYDQTAAKKNLTDPKPLEELLSALQDLDNWQKESISAVIKSITEKLNTKMMKVALPLRVAVTGKGTSPSIDITLELIGKTRTLRRIQRTIDYIEKSN